MRTIRLGVAVAASLAATAFTTACAPAISGSAASISRLEQASTANPQSEAAQRSLGIAYFKGSRFVDARTALAKAASMDHTDGVAALYLGLTAEAQQDYPAAEQAYQAYLDVGKTRAVKNQIRERMQAIKLQAIQAASKAALARETQLAATPGPANTIAVRSFEFSGSDTSLKPIERGFAELVTTDLSRVSQLTVVERERLQSLLDELDLQQTAGISAGTGVRAGKILQVGRMVGGTIEQQGAQLTTNAVVTNVSTSALGPAARATNNVDDIFTMEKNIVFALLQNLGITPTTAERNAIEQRPTRSMQAFLAYSHGLELLDRGRTAEASSEFQRAVQIDPSFSAAQQRSSETKTAVNGAAVSAQTVETALRGSSEGDAIGGTQSTYGGSMPGGAGAIADGLNPSMPGAASYGGSTTQQPLLDPSGRTGGDNVGGQTARVTIIIRQP